MRHYLLLMFLLLTMLNGCAYSLREQAIRSKIPARIKGYQGGLQYLLQEDDIAQAVEFGKNNKNNPDVIRYAFLIKKEKSHLFSQSFYINIFSNFHLLSLYAAQSSKLYEQPDEEYIKFLANLDTFQIKCYEHTIDLNTMVQHSREAPFIILKDGVKIQNAAISPSYKGQNPYIYLTDYRQAYYQELMNKSVQNSLEYANQLSKQYQKALGVNSPANMQMPTLTVTADNLFYYKDFTDQAIYEIVIMYHNKEYKYSLELQTIR
ncbi:MAG: hypothetical protein KKH94_12335 [Candidatus Omnitrophica bacterium]|nr:hypothetical protein [Candidatus Omnitrophota bacterium]